MSVLVISNDVNSERVKHIKEILYALGADIVRYQVVGKHALPDVQNLSIHDEVILVKDKLLPEHIKIYKSYIQDFNIRNLKIY
jgi:hypothetical protein